MKRMIALIASVASAALLVLATPAQAGPIHVDVNIGIPLPILVQPRPYYGQPSAVYVQPNAVYVQPSPVYVQQWPGYRYDYRYGDYWAQRQRAEHDWREHEWREHHDWHDHDREWHDHH